MGGISRQRKREKKVEEESRHVREKLGDMEEAEWVLHDRI